MSSPLIGQITMFGFNFAPRDWAFCQGQQMAISQNTPLFSLLGTQFGGNGQSTFGLPDMRGRTPVGFGQGINTGTWQMGEMLGADTAALTAANMPVHNHTAALHVNSAPANKPVSTDHYLADGLDINGKGVRMYTTTAPDVTLASGSVTTANAGGSQPFSILQPSLGVNFSIALMGIFPSRN